MTRCSCNAVCVCGNCSGELLHPCTKDECGRYPCYHALLKRDAEVMYQELMSEVYEKEK